MPHRGQSLNHSSCPLPGSRHHACSGARKIASAPPSAHTHFRAAWTKESILLSSLSALLGTCLLPPPPPSLACQAPLTRDTAHAHTHIEAHTCSHMLTHIYMWPHTHTGKHSQTRSFIYRDTSTFRETSPHVHVHIHTQRDGEGLMASGDEAWRAGHMGSST